MFQALLDLPYLERCKIVLNSTSHMSEHKAELYFLKEDNPLKYMEYLAGDVDRVSGHQLGEMKEYTLWIKLGSYYHLSVLRRLELDHCPHLQYTPRPSANAQRPSVAALDTHMREFVKARQNPQIPKPEFWRIQDRYVKALHLHGQFT